MVEKPVVKHDEPVLCKFKFHKSYISGGFRQFDHSSRLFSQPLSFQLHRLPSVTDVLRTMSKTIVLAALLVAVLVAVVLAAPAPKRKGPRGPSKHAGHHRRPRSPVAYYADNFYGEDYNDYYPLALDYKNFPDLQNEYYDAMYNYYYPYAEPRPIYG